MNVDKNSIVVFLKTKANDICVKLSGITITKVQHCRYLGIFSDDTLAWSHHVDTIYGMPHVGSGAVKIGPTPFPDRRS